jgi:hypothetical protein
MTMRARVLGALLAVALSLATAGGCTPREGLDPSKLPENIRADYDVFARKCSKCHSLARPLNSNISDDEQWVLYVNRMRRQPASGISPEDQTVILRFLRYYAAELRRKQAEKNAPPAPQSVPVLTPSTSVPEGTTNADGGGL